MDGKQKSELTAPSQNSEKKSCIAQLWSIITGSLSSDNVACGSQPHLRAAPESPAWARSLYNKHRVRFRKTKNGQTTINYTDHLRAPLHLHNVAASRRNVDRFENALRSKTANDMAAGRTEIHGPRLLPGPG